MNRKEKQFKVKPASKEKDRRHPKRRLKDQKEKYRHANAWLLEEEIFDLDYSPINGNDQSMGLPK